MCKHFSASLNSFLHSLHILTRDFPRVYIERVQDECWARGRVAVQLSRRMQTLLPPPQLARTRTRRKKPLHLNLSSVKRAEYFLHWG